VVRWRIAFWLQLLLTLMVAAFLLVPVGLSIIAGVTRSYLTGIESGVTLKWVWRVLDLYSDTIWLSLGIAAACLAVTLLIGVPLAYVLARSQGWLGRTIEELIVLPIAIPGLAIALALIVTYGSVGAFRQNWSFILTGHVLFTLPFMVRPVLAVMASGGLRELEDSAASLGASFRQRFVSVVLPNARSGILAGSLMVITLSIGEFNLTWMLHTPVMKTLPIGLADSYASMRLEVASAYTLIFFVLIVPLLAAIQIWSDLTRIARTRPAGGSRR